MVVLVLDEVEAEGLRVVSGHKMDPGFPRLIGAFY